MMRWRTGLNRGPRSTSAENLRGPAQRNASLAFQDDSSSAKASPRQHAAVCGFKLGKDIIEPDPGSAHHFSQVWAASPAPSTLECILQRASRFLYFAPFSYC